MEKRRVGKFSIDREYIYDMPEIVRAIMGRCIIVRCELMFDKNAFEYVAISPDFDLLPKGEIAPTYNVLVTFDAVSAEPIVMFKRLRSM